MNRKRTRRIREKQRRWRYELYSNMIFATQSDLPKAMHVANEQKKNEDDQRKAKEMEVNDTFKYWLHNTH
jgi:hypothetical protein